MNRVCLIVALVIGLLMAGCSWLSFKEETPERVIVMFEDGRYAAGLRKALEGGFNIYKELGLIDGIACNLTPTQQRWAEEFLPVRLIEPDFDVSIVNVPKSLTVGISEEPSEEVVPWGVERINAPDVWAMGVTGRGVRVGVIDTGINSSHPDLINADETKAVVGGFNAIDPTMSWEDDNNHGTYIATIIGARHNEVGIIGVAPEATLYAIKVLSASGSGSSSSVVAGYMWALANDLKVVNLSLGSFYHSFAMKEAMIRAAWQGLGTIAASGNDGQEGIIYPARDPVAVCVGATGLNNEKMSWSNWGPALKANGVVAPGNWILAGNKDGGWQRIAGTSAATPHVTGLVALLEDTVQKGWCERRFIFGGATGALDPTESVGYGLIDCAATFQMMVNEAVSNSIATEGTQRRGDL